MPKYIALILLILLSIPLFCVDNNPDLYRQEQETVTFLETTNINDFLQVLESFSWKYARKKIINMSSHNEPIGIPIHNLPWRKALEIVALQNELDIQDNVGVIYVKNKEVKLTIEQALKLPEKAKDIDTKQVRISAVAFNCDRAYLKSLGIDWSTILNGKVEANVDFASASLVPDPVISVDLSRSTTIGSQTIEVNTLLKAIESNQVGTVIARPTVVVSSGKSGFIQVGQDVSVKTVDDAGNTTDKFFQTGVIMDVQPVVLTQDSTNDEVIHLIASVERSSATPGTVSTVINKSKSTTDVILYNGEETVVGGLYDTDEIKVRTGIPFLKDLPWWVFGIRYLTGFNKTDKKERELVFIIKAEILDSALIRQQKALLNK